MDRPRGGRRGEGLQHGQAHPGVQARGLEQLLAQGAAELGDLALQAPAGVLDDAAHQGVAVGVQPGGAQGDQDVAGAHLLSAEHPVRFDDAGGGPGDVVLVGGHEAGVLGGLPAQQRGADGGAGLGDAAHDVGDPLGDDVPAGDVVGHEQGAGPDHDDVVDDHAHQVLADGVVDVEGLGDGDLGAHPVGGGGQQGAAVVAQGGDVHEPGEAPDAADDGRGHGGGHGVLHERDGPVPGGGVHAGIGVGDGEGGLLRLLGLLGHVGAPCGLGSKVRWQAEGVKAQRVAGTHRRRRTRGLRRTGPAGRGAAGTGALVRSSTPGDCRRPGPGG